MQTLFPGVHLIECRIGGRPLHLPLLIGESGALLMDTGTREIAEETVIPALREALGGPERLRWIITTHPDGDHQGGNALLKRFAPRALLVCGTADRELVEDPERLTRERYDAWRADHGVAYPDTQLAEMRRSAGDPQPVDLTFAGGERIRLAGDWLLEVLRLPGHSRGHLAVLDHRHHVLFAADALHGRCYPGPDGPSMPPTYLEVDPYLDTIRTVQALARGKAITAYAGCHWPVCREEEEVSAFCEESRRFCIHTEQLVLAEVRRSEGVGLGQLMERLGPQLGDWPRRADADLCFVLGGHLDLLERRGAVHAQREGGIKVYRV